MKGEKQRRWQLTLWGLFGLVSVAAYAATFGREFGAGGASMILGLYAGMWFGSTVTRRTWAVILLAVSGGVLGAAIGVAIDIAILIRC